MKIDKTIAVVFLLFLQSCSTLNYQSAYDASPPIIPLHQKQGELKATAGYGHFLGFSGQASYAVTKNLAVFGAGTLNRQELATMGLFNSIDYKTNNYNYNGGLGFYKTLTADSIILEMYVGYGLGLTDKKYSLDNNFIMGYDETVGKYRKHFYQVNIGQVKSDKFEYGLSAKLTRLHFKDIAFNYNVYHDSFLTGTEEYNVLYSKSMLLVEPSFKLAYGYKNLKFITQSGLAFPVVNGNTLKNAEGDSYAATSLILNAGVQFQLNTKK